MRVSDHGFSNPHRTSPFLNQIGAAIPSASMQRTGVYEETYLYPMKGRQVQLSRSEVILLERHKAMPKLHQAIAAGNYGAALLMLSNQPSMDVNERGPFGWTPLHTVAQAFARSELHGGNRLRLLEELATQLLARGACVDLVDVFDLTPLASAAGKGPKALRQAVADHTALLATDQDDTEDDDGKKRRATRHNGI